MKRFLMFFIVFMGLVSFSSALEWTEVPTHMSQATKTSSNADTEYIGGYLVYQIYDFFKSTDISARNQMLTDVYNAGYYVIWSPSKADFSSWYTTIYPVNNVDFGTYSSTTTFRGFMYFNSGDIAYCKKKSTSSAFKYTFTSDGYTNPDMGDYGSVVSWDDFNSYIASDPYYFGSFPYVKKLYSNDSGNYWTGEYHFYREPIFVEPEIPDYSSDLAGLISAITTSDVVKDNKIHGRDEFFIIPYGSVSGKNLYDIYFYGDYLSLSAFEYLGSDGNLYYDLNKTIDNGLASFIANIWGEEKVKGSYFSALYDTETGNIDVVYNGSFLFSSYDMQGFSSELNPIIYTTKDIPYYYYEKDETTGEWIATADENKNIVNEVITDSEGNEISNEIVGSSDSVANTPWNRFVSVIKSIPDAILNGIKSLFVPDDTYFSEHFERLKTALYNRLPITSYLSIIETFKDVVSGELSPITIELYGTTHTIVDFSYFNEHKATINNWVRGFVYFFLVLYNIGQIYKLIRGDTLTGNALQFGQNKKG